MSALLAHFEALDHLLYQTRRYWQCVAFSCSQYPWPELARVLDDLSDEQVAQLEADPQQLLAFFHSYIPELVKLDKLSVLPQRHGGAEQATLPFWLSNGIKGRKLTQLQAFVAHLQPEENAATLLEWCAGKGHLGRLLAHQYGIGVQSVEIQPQLCAQGEELAQRFSLPIRFNVANVLEDDCQSWLRQCDHAVALHACGGLHQELMRQASRLGTPRLSISPCCYHLFIDGERYQAMSQAAGASQNSFYSSDLKLALQQTVTAGQRVQRLRQTEVQWRLGFDQLVRDVFARSEYTPVPSVGKQVFSGEFKDFCQWAATQKGLTLPQDLDYPHYLALGADRKHMTDRIELVRHLFRRAIEVWLVLDRALYLQQANYRVDIFEFCEASLTPRNIFIEAKLN
ncbi:methyltransferase [Pseudoalteromonas sp. BDTF-M6]|uniref:methyltransferase n=1 Tax=Pseudoalteromonas sp. BDTF-M6 TaxID=2796132 RepID=UPI001BAEE253|nr:methyltransferase [Pseudoalteromonas sp. BDTF-M6]MBS3799149.1 methyltransferase [Pseudoalteromonas sp. BDTF-M6]